MAGVIGIGVVALVMLGVLAQPQSAWNAAAEHSKRFWSVWALTFVTVGLVPALVTSISDETPELPTGWALIWLLVCCAGAVLQPAMWTDVLETRRRRARARDVAPAPPAPALRPPSLSPALRSALLSEIRWYAPSEPEAGQTRPDYTRMGTSA